MEGKLRISLAALVLLSVASQLKASVCYRSTQRLNAYYGSTYSLSSPNYPFNYNNNKNCYWYIAASSSNMVIKVTFIDFYLQSSTSCSKDFVEIRDGRYSSSTFIGRYCSSTKPPVIISKGQYLYIKFHSNSMSTYRGFRLTYTTSSPVTRYSGICSPLYSFKVNNDIQMRSEQGTIKSPNYPFNYPNNMQCTWKITVPSGKRIKLTIDYMSMQSSLFCTADYLQVRDGYYSSSSKKGNYCGSTRKTIYSSSRYLWIRFRSDHQINYKGFSLSYSTKESSSSSVSSGTIVGVLVAIAVIVGIVICVVCSMKKNGSRGVVVQNSAPASRSTANTTTLNVTIAAPQGQGFVIPCSQAPPPYQQVESYPQKGRPYAGPPPMGEPNPYPGPPPMGQTNPYPGPSPMGQPNPYPGPSSMEQPNPYPGPPHMGQANPYPGPSPMGQPNPYPMVQPNPNPPLPPPGNSNSSGPPTVSM